MYLAQGNTKRELTGLGAIRQARAQIIDPTEPQCPALQNEVVNIYLPGQGETCKNT